MIESLRILVKSHSRIPRMRPNQRSRGGWDRCWMVNGQAGCLGQLYCWTVKPVDINVVECHFNIGELVVDLYTSSASYSPAAQSVYFSSCQSLLSDAQSMPNRGKDDVIVVCPLSEHVYIR